MKIDPKLAQKGLVYAQITSTLNKRALDKLEPYQQDAEKAAAAREPLMELLLDVGCVPAHQKEAADELLSTHNGTMSLLKSAVEHIRSLAANQKEANDLGSGVDPAVVNGAVGSAQFDSLNSPFVGRKTSEKKASDQAYEAALLGRGQTG